LPTLLLASCASSPTANPTPESATTCAVEPPATVPGVVPASAHASLIPEQAPTSQPASWQVTASAYLWLASKRGVIELENVGIPLEDPDESTGAFFYLEAERDRWGLIGDLDLLSSTDRTDIATGTVKVEEDTLIGELDATWRVAEGSSLQLLLGLRVLDSEQDIDRPVLPDVSTDTTQVDPVVGAQGTWPLGESLQFRLRGDVGGFGIDSELTYQMFGVLAWELLPHWSLTAGYRLLGWEFESDGIDNDLRLSGLLFGLAARF
jgi:hypothetical protein